MSRSADGANVGCVRCHLRLIYDCSVFFVFDFDQIENSLYIGLNEEAINDSAARVRRGGILCHGAIRSFFWNT